MASRRSEPKELRPLGSLRPSASTGRSSLPLGNHFMNFKSYDLFMMGMFRLLPTAKLAILPGGHGEFIGGITAVKEGSKLPEMIVAIIDEFLDVP